MEFRKVDMKTQFITRKEKINRLEHHLYILQGLHFRCKCNIEKERLRKEMNRVSTFIK